MLNQTASNIIFRRKMKFNKKIKIVSIPMDILKEWGMQDRLNEIMFTMSKNADGAITVTIEPIKNE